MSDSYRNPSRPEGILIREEDMEVAEKTPKRTINEGIKCSFVHLIPFRDELIAWLEENNSEHEEIAKILQETFTKAADNDTHRTPAKSEVSVKRPGSDLEKRRKTDRTSTSTKKKKEPYDAWSPDERRKTDGTSTSTKRKKEPYDTWSPDESAGKRGRNLSKSKRHFPKKVRKDEYSSDRRRAAAVKNSELINKKESAIRKMKTKSAPIRWSEERFPDDYSSAQEREERNELYLRKRFRSDRYLNEGYDNCPNPAEQAGPSFWYPSSPGERYNMQFLDTWNPAADILISDIEPDTSKSDFYCCICDSHMNNRNMWEAHVRGKRHQKNLKKRPGELPAKLKYIKSSSSSSKLDQLLRNVDEKKIIIGLDYVRESQGEAGEIYNCFLCGACCTSLDIIDHLILPKHRLKYLEKIDANELITLRSLDIPQIYRDQVIEDVARQYEAKHGRGKVEVYVKRSYF